jgi:dTDP-4-dehydrorhamnose 3,5-epimerase
VSSKHCSSIKSNVGLRFAIGIQRNWVLNPDSVPIVLREAREQNEVFEHRDNPMKFREFDVPDLRLVVPRRFTDARGFFSEIWIDRWFREQIADLAFVQDNQTVSARKATVRGLHFQKPPMAQGKLVRVVRGSIFDVAVDIRRGSPSYRQHVVTRLDAAEGAQLWVPPGFLHGFCTLEDETEVYYKVTSYYSPSHEVGVVWNDQDLGINWPVEPKAAVLSDKDKRHPCLRDLPEYFDYEG